jgi:hypothetical protein
MTQTMTKTQTDAFHDAGRSRALVDVLDDAGKRSDHHAVIATFEVRVDEDDPQGSPARMSLFTSRGHGGLAKLDVPALEALNSALFVFFQQVFDWKSDEQPGQTD